MRADRFKTAVLEPFDPDDPADRLMQRASVADYFARAPSVAPPGSVLLLSMYHHGTTCKACPPGCEHGPIARLVPISHAEAMQVAGLPWGEGDRRVLEGMRTGELGEREYWLVTNWGGGHITVQRVRRDPAGVVLAPFWGPS